MVFRPTWEEFKDFNKYILYMESLGAHEAGLAKIVPPPEWKPRAKGYETDDINNIVIPSPISQVVTGKQGIYQQLNIQKKSMTVRELKALAETERHRTPTHFDYDELDRKYWKNITYGSPIYGADVSGSLTDENVKEWNINKLGSILDYVNEDYGISIDGVNTAYLYFGMWKTTFAWHTEDMDLYSINYLHYGAPKTWYCIPPKHGSRLERLANGYFSSNHKECPAYLRHKMTMISPSHLKKYSIPYNKITQEAGEFMVTFPYGYHAGFNHGYNCAESTNFASPRWVEYGKRATQCFCRSDMVKISMDTFVKRFQPEKYDMWIQGKDVGCHPENSSRQTAAPKPTRSEVLCNKNNECVPENFVDSERTKPKRHLIHEQRDDGDKEYKEDKDELLQAEDKAEDSVDPDEELADEETIEVMKSIWFKAGEMEDDLSSDEDKKKKKSSKARKQKLSSSSKYKRIKSETQRPLSTSEIADPLAIEVLPSSKTATPPSSSTACESTSSLTLKKVQVTYSSKSSLALPANFLSSSQTLAPFRIPKKSPSDISLKGDMNTLRQWSDADTAASFTLAKMATSAKERSSSMMFPHHQKGSVPRNNVRTDSVPTQIRHTSHSINYISKPSSAVELLPFENTKELAPASGQLLKAISSKWCADASKAEAAAAAAASQTSQLKQLLLGVQQSPLDSSPPPLPPARRDSNVSSSSSRTGIWEQQSSWTMAQEADYNFYCSQQEPHCSVCSLLSTSRPSSSSFSSGQWRKSPPIRPISSRVLISEEFVSRSHPDCDSHKRCPTSLDTPEMISALFRCTKCRVCVHAKCYGIAETLSLLDWQCRRCQRDGNDDVKCCLCFRKGGALKPTADGRWAHIICAICIPQVYFDQIESRDAVNVASVGRDSIASDCVYCKDKSGGSVFYRGVYVACSVPQCSEHFHVSCGFNFGARFVLPTSGASNVVDVTCSRHTLKRKDSPATSVCVNVDEQVIARHPTKGYIQAKVVNSLCSVTHYWVDFSDGSTSTDTSPEYILNYPVENGPPPLGAAVHVQWTDGKNYEGIYRGSLRKPLYKLGFDDNTTVSVERADFYLLGEALPKKVKDHMELDAKRRQDSLEWIQKRNIYFSNQASL